MTLNFVELEAKSNAFANGLLGAGVAPGDRVTLYGANLEPESPEATDTGSSTLRARRRDHLKVPVGFGVVGVAASGKELADHCREHLAAYKSPRPVQFVESVPVTSSGKIMRRLLNEVDDGQRVLGEERVVRSA